MDVIVIVLSSLILIGLVILIVLLITKKDKKMDIPITQIDMKEIGILNNKLDNMPNELKHNMEYTVSKEINNLSASLNDSQAKVNERNNDKLERFQNNITESLNKRFDALNKQMDDKLSEINKKVDEKLKEGFEGTTETMTQVRERLQAIDAAQRNIESLSTDVISLKNVLEGNQTRGQYGEYQLSMVLHNVFGDVEGAYKEQYTMKKVKDGDDVRADAVVCMPEPNKMICVDSKFPFSAYKKLFDNENKEDEEQLIKTFNSDVKKHITTIKDKYIVEGKTAQEAIMFIPNDGVFAFIHHNCQEVVNYAREKRVVITSPSTLPSILFTINMVKIEAERAKNAKIISDQLTKLGKQFGMFEKEWAKFSNAIDSAAKGKDALNNRVSRISSNFEQISTNSINEKDTDDPLEIENNDSF